MSQLVTIRDFIKNNKKNTILYGSLESNLNLYYSERFLDYDTSDNYFNLFENLLVNIENSKVTINNGEYYLNRKQISYGDVNNKYSYSWNVDNKICNTIRTIKSKVELFTGSQYNYVLINRYEDGSQGIGYHSDRETNNIKGVQVAGISLGAVRPIYFKPIDEKFIHTKLPNKVKIELLHGSLYVMNYPTNEYWKHSIPKKSTNIINRPRISLTFRWIDD